jgi:hypothetical protein
MALSLLVIALPAKAVAVQVSATLNPERIGLQETARLSVTVQGNQASEPALPRVDGLEFTPMGQSSSFQSINGTTSASVSHLYQVTATRAGTFTIPAIRIGSASTRPLALQVLYRAGTRNSAGSSPGTPLPSPSFGSSSQPFGPNAPGQKQAGFLQVLTPQRKLYVGELVPVQIKAFIRSGVSAGLDGLPMLSCDAFTMTKLTDKPDQSQELLDGVPYTVLTWPAALSAVKAGDYSLNLDLPIRVRVQERAAQGERRNPFKQFFGNMPFDDSFFGDSFFDDFFGQTTEKKITLHASLADMKVLSLPTAGRPADFSGAVGQFQLQAEVNPSSASAGDPLTLKLTVSGTGNFDRVTTSGLPNSAAWKTYKPGAQFEPGDSVGLSGRKVFEQAVVPEQAGRVQLPPLAFSYFDPEAGLYVTRHTQPLPVEVAAASNAPAHIDATAPARSTLRAAPAKESADPDELSPNAIESDRFVASLQPVLFRPAFIAVPGTSLALLACGLWFVKRRDRRAANTAHTRNVACAAALRQYLAQMDHAANTGDETAFFASARRVLQERLAQAWHVSPNAVTLTEINARLNGAGEDICAVFRAADQTAYARQSRTPVALHEWQQRVHEQLKHLEES